MINGTVIDTSIWVNYYNSVMDERSEIVNKLIDDDDIVILPVILQERCKVLK